ncbi:MarR family transcriptional regulator [Sphingomonas sp. 3P27F8]|uniref:MarR family winged helix-turn-helix transcriptional regulator n=1 Tax=Sphingomonas sp. 3P27F8 TaxID=2502213 RepID=UPI0010F882F2|nr:MarR family transcriptional regulator [Sphingomonas sp. 3P27F8]
MKSDPVLDHLLGYRLKRVAIATDQEARGVLEPFGVTPARLTTLLLVRTNPGCDQTALGRALSINRSSAMKLVNVLSERGLIERRPGRDARTNALYLTQEGGARLDEMVAAIERSDQALADRLTADEQAELARLLDKLVSQTTGD